ncbi:MAG: prephenate dehydrogenase/arogenate dehydrogenase family protein, partial [Chloroflexi bacterium]|nr:prephenate dehydrogenase/arogenate dehydrogenase family protein [Chloroflexota bacterium]
RTGSEALGLAEELVEAVGGRPLVMEAARHDWLVSVISHLPYLLACGLVGTAEQVSQRDDAVWTLAASGFRDTSRLAASDVTMMLDTLLTNRDMVLDALAICDVHLQRLANLVRNGDAEGLSMALTAMRERRERMFR